MTIEKDARAAVTETRQSLEQHGQKVHDRAVENLDTAASEIAEERELITQQRQEADHLKDTMLSRAQESLETSEDDSAASS